MNHYLKQSVTVLKGIGEETAESLAEMKIYTVQDLLEYFPYRYEDYRLRDLTEVQHEEKITVEGKVHSEPSLTYFGRKKSKLMIRMFVGQYLIKVVFFNQPYLKSKLVMNNRRFFSFLGEHAYKRRVAGRKMNKKLRLLKTMTVAPPCSSSSTGLVGMLP